MLNFFHTYLYFKDLTRTYFCGIYVILWDFVEVKKSKFLIPKICDLAFCRLTGRSTEKEVGRPVRSIDVHKHARPFRLEVRSTGPVDCPESSAIWKWSRSTGRELLLSVSSPSRPGGRSVAQRS